MMIAIVFIVFFVGLALAVPIAVALVYGAWAPIMLGAPGLSGIGYLIRNAFSGADTTPIIAVPLFIFAGVIMAEGGISRRLFNIFAYQVGKKTAGMPIAVILTCIFYSSISGSGPATTAAVGAMAIPFLVELGYDKKFVASLIAVTGGLGVVLPPSIPFVLYSLATGVSLSALFLAGILPGLFIGLCMMIHAYFYCKTKGEDTERIHARVNELRKTKFSILFRDSIWALISPIIVLGGIYSGFFTPTEAACVSVFYSLIISVFVYKSVPVREMPRFMRQAVKTYAPLCFVIAFAIAFGRVLAMLKAPALISDFLLGKFTTQISLILVLLFILYTIGMVMDTGPVIVIMAPILLPIVASVGVHPVHFGVIMVVNLSIGLSTPPFGLHLFVTGALSDLPPMTIAKKGLPFMGTYTVALVIIALVPAFSLLLL